MAMLKTYIGNFEAMALAPGTSQLPALRILNTARSCLIKSIIWSAFIWNLTTNEQMSFSQNLAVSSELHVFFGYPAPQLLGEPFLSVLPPAPQNARTLNFYRPGSWRFEGIFFNQNLEVANYFTSLDLVNTYQISSCIIIEIEEIDIYKGQTELNTSQSGLRRSML